jgi:hypothetical protein
MAKVSDTIPEGLQPEVDAAINWFNKRQDNAFEVTGIVDAEHSLASKGSKELRLVLCGGDTCQQKSFNVSIADEGFDVSLAVKKAVQGEVQPELDPPPGARNPWLDSVINKHKFVILVFYRGFW